MAESCSFTKAAHVLCCSCVECEMISYFIVESRECVVLCQLVHWDLFKLAEVSLITIREVK